MPQVVLGIDGGQTATIAAVCDRMGRLLGLGRGGPANHVWAPGGVERARRAVVDSMVNALERANLPPSTEFAAAFLGMPGQADPLKLEAVEGAVRTRRFRMENDKVNALASVTAGKPGVVVIAGTGTITYGENARGESADASGWGYLLGDEGAGYWIARQAVAAACRHWDRRGEQTLMTEKLLRTLEVTDLWEVYFLVYSEKFSRSDFAALARLVPEAAAEGDVAAGRLLRRAGRELGLAAGTVAKRLRMHRGAVTVGMVGGVFQGSALVRQSFRREVRRHAPKAVLAQARFSPAAGSVLLALKLAGVPITNQVLLNLEQAPWEAK